MRRVGLLLFFCEIADNPRAKTLFLGAERGGKYDNSQNIKQIAA